MPSPGGAYINAQHLEDLYEDQEDLQARRYKELEEAKKMPARDYDGDCRQTGGGYRLLPWIPIALLSPRRALTRRARRARRAAAHGAKRGRAKTDSFEVEKNMVMQLFLPVLLLASLSFAFPAAADPLDARRHRGR